MRIYISGKVTGEDLAECREKFQKAQRELEAEGYEVVNPLAVSEKLPELKYDEYMMIDVVLLDICDGIYLLPDWTKSDGALMEWMYAKSKGLTVKKGQVEK